jgi:NAD-dependent dihydropyrimidine dehydrogenase PreA subunit
MTYVSGLTCVDLKDKTCIEECPVDCIYEGERMLYIHPDECVDCGACEPVCPVQAIAYEDDLSEADAPFADAAKGVFAEFGSPGGAAGAPKVPDPPLVLALRPQEHDDV